jgi:hypothetical protein
MLLHISALVFVIAFVCCAPIVAQSPKAPDNENTFHGVTLSFVSQRCLPSDKVPHVGQDFIDFSDLVTRFRLANTGSQEVFYLVDHVLSGIEPVGFQLFRPNKDSDWMSIYSPARGRRDIFTGDAFKWLRLKPGSAIEFESSDVSGKEGEHATSVFLNLKPVHKNRSEIVSNTFAPVKCVTVVK